VKLNLSHLTREEHQRVAELLTRAQANLGEAARIVKRAPFIDRYLDVAGAVQEYMIDPLKDCWDDARGYGDNPYPSVAYIGPMKVRRQMKAAMRHAASPRHLRGEA
jgi:hypothetical protein